VGRDRPQQLFGGIVRMDIRWAARTLAAAAGTLLLATDHSGMCLTVRGASQAAGARIVQLGCWPRDHSQQWYSANF
jgi:hypothetical protein